MNGKIIDMNFTDAFISFQDGSTINISISHLPLGSKIGDNINIDFKPTQLINDKLTNFF